MENLISGLFVLLCLVSAVLQYIATRTKSQKTSGNNPQFLSFQKQFFFVYFLALFSDWLQGPYVYKLYSHYGFAESQIAALYVVGFGSSVVFGTATGAIADKFGRKKMCVAFTVLYSVCCLTKLSPNFNVLLLGRILGGISTSMLFSTFESWYVYEHISTHDFPPEWISVTFAKTTFGNGLLAILAGVVANFAAETLDYGPVAPFVIAVPCLIMCGVMVSTTWKENYGSQTINLRVSCTEGLRTILFNENILLLGLVQSVFESVMYIFVFLWTPILDPAHPPLGLLFACFMVCIMLGSSVYAILTSRKLRSDHVLALAVFVLLVCMCACIISTDPHHPHLWLSLTAFLLLEIAVGMYFPAVGFLRSQIIPEEQRASIMNWFRVPMNMMTCGGLLWLHNEENDGGNQMMFMVCAVMLCVGVFLSIKLTVLIKPEPKLLPLNTSSPTALEKQ